VFALDKVFFFFQIFFFTNYYTLYLQVTLPTRRVTINEKAVHSVIVVDGYLVINDSQVNVDPAYQSRPLYWAMPAKFLGDKVCLVACVKS
jgi:hypothetical protein